MNIPQWTYQVTFKGDKEILQYVKQDLFELAIMSAFPNHTTIWYNNDLIIQWNTYLTHKLNSPNYKFIKTIKTLLKKLLTIGKVIDAFIIIDSNYLIENNAGIDFINVNNNIIYLKSLIKEIEI